MPIYDFKCRDCGNKFTVLAPLSQRDKIICPKCQSRDVRQTVSPFGLFGRSSSGDVCGSGGFGGG